MLKEFRAFILRGNVVDLAVGVVIGAAFGTIVTAIVKGFIDPLVSFVGTGDLADKGFCVGTCTAKHPGHFFNYGSVISTIISFVIIAAVVFFFVVKPIDRLTEMFKTDQPEDKKTRECPECLSSIPVAAHRCAFCTAVISPSRA